MGEYDMTDLDDTKAKKDIFHMDSDAFALNYPDGSEANLLFNANNNSNLTKSEESLKALLVQPSESSFDTHKALTRRPHPRMSWIFAKGYGARVRTDSGHMVQCCVGDCRRLYITNNGSTSAFKKHLEKVHNLVEFPNQLKSQSEKSRIENNGSKSRRQYAPRKPRAGEAPVTLQELPPQREITPLPLPIAQDGQLLNLLQYGGTPVSRELMVPSSVLADNRKHLARSREALKEFIILQVSISLSIDHWINPHLEDVLCISAHFITERWEPQEVLLDIQIKKDMTGVEAARIVMSTIDGYGISALVSTITTSNSPMMIIMVERLGQESSSRSDFNFDSSTDHISCLSFVINSAANGALALGEQSHNGSIMKKLNKVRLGINSINKTPHALKFYQNLFSMTMQEHLALIVDEPLRWDLTYQMAERLLMVQTAYNETCSNCGFAELALNQADRELVEEVKNLLGPLQAFAVRVSTQRCPTITQTLPLYDKVLLYLDSVAQNKPAFIQQAYQYAHQTFRSHFGKACPNVNFAFASVIDPRLKILGWVPPVYSPEDAENLTALVRSFWEKNYNRSQDFSRLEDFPQSTFDTIFQVDPVPLPDDLSRYIRDPVISSKYSFEEAVYDFWRVNHQVYPQLARFARRFLPIPITSMPCGRQLVYNRQLVSSAPKDPEVSQMIREFSLLYNWRKSSFKSEQ